MERETVVVVARVRAKSGKEEELRNVLQALIKPTTAEGGCQSYDLHQAEGDAGSFLFYERWCSHQDLDDHMRTPHLQSFLGRCDELLAAPVDISLWKLVS